MMKHRAWRSERCNRGAILLGVMLIIILISITLISAQFYAPTEQRKTREKDLEFKLSELRKALFEAIARESNLHGEARTVSAFIYGPAILPYKVETGESILTAAMTAKYGFPPLEIRADDSSEIVTSRLLRVLKEEGYLRTDYQVPLLEGYRFVREDGSIDEDVRIGWRVAENLLASSSFEQDVLEKPMQIEQLLDAEHVNQYWFSITENYEHVHATTTVEPPPEVDYPGQRTTEGRRGKYGGRVMILRLPE